MRVGLINPPRSPHNGILEHGSDEAKRYIHKKLIGPPLGLLTLAAHLKDHHDVSLLEMKGEYDLVPDSPSPDLMVWEYLEKHRPSVVGVSFIASEFPLGMEILQTVKRFDPDIVTVAGGLHANLCPQDFRDPAVDIVCPGPGAYIFREIVEAAEEKSGFSHICDIIDNSEGLFHPTQASGRLLEPAGRDFIMPDRSLLTRWLSTYVVGRAKGPSTYLFTSLGCPYRCSFCSIWPQFDGKYLQREVESIIAELRQLDEYEVVRFCDANTLVNLDFVHHLFDRIASERLKKTFIMDIRVDTAAKHPRLIEKLAKGGLKVVIAGFESTSQEELTRYNKQLDAGVMTEGIRVFHENGIMLRGNYIIPTTYGDEDFRRLTDYAANHPVDFAGYTILTPFPGTLLYDDMKGEICDFDLAKYNMFNAVTRTNLDIEEFYRRVSSLWLIRRGDEVI